MTTIDRNRSPLAPPTTGSRPSADKTAPTPSSAATATTGPLKNTLTDSSKGAKPAGDGFESASARPAQQASLLGLGKPSSDKQFDGMLVGAGGRRYWRHR